MERDPCESRHGGSERSVEAFEQVEHSAARQRDWCLQQIRRAGQFGLTCDQLAASASRSCGREVPPNRISGRLTELKRDGLVVRSQVYRSRATRAGGASAVASAAGAGADVQAEMRPEP